MLMASRRPCSCATQLLTVFHDIGKNLDQNVQTDVLYIFIDLQRLYLQRSLHERFQRVVVDGAWFLAGHLLLQEFRKEVFWALCCL